MKSTTLAALLISVGTVSAEAPAITIDVDPRVELFSIVQYIGGRMDNRLPTRYAAQVRAHFDRFKTHRAVELIRAMTTDQLAWGIPAALGVAVTPLPELRARDTLPTRLALNPTSRDTVAMYVDAVRDFARVSGFEQFYRDQRPFYDQLAAATRARMGTIDYLAEVERFWGARQALYAIHLSPLMPAGGVGPSVVRPDGSREVHSILGAFFQRDSVPIFGSATSLRNLVLHEFSHSFVNPLTARHADAVARWELLLMPLRNRLRQADGLTTWEHAVNEFVIRAFTANVTARLSGDSAAAAFVAGQRQLGFMYLPRFREWLADYEADRTRWPTFADYLPTLIDRFAELAGSNLVSDSLQPPFAGDFSMARWSNEEFIYVFVVPTAERDPALQDSLHAMVRRIRDTGFPSSMIVRDIDALDQDLSRFSVWAWGTPEGNRYLRKHRRALPIGIHADSVVVGDSTFTGQGMVVIMALRNPQNPRVPLLVSTGQRIEEVARSFWNWSADYAVMDGTSQRAIGDWPVKTAERWGFP